MKLIKTLTVVACAFAFIATTAMADDKPAKLPGCCAKAKKEGKDCSHPCCVEAKKDGKTCEKCAAHKSKKAEKKADDAAK